MTNEQRLVNQIRTFLRSYDREKNPVVEDMADQLADLCYALNERLLKCEEYLQKGRRSEAVHEAQVPPPLLEQVSVLNFPELREWTEFCVENGMSVSPELRTDIAERLRSECSTEELLAPLLFEYRRLVHQGEPAQRIQVLRQILAVDRGNKVWIENLAPLEEEALEVLLKEADQALAAKDILRLQEIRDELLDERRVVPAPVDTVIEVESVLRRHREEHAAEEGAKAVNALQAVAEAEDWDAVRDALQKWQRLISYEDFHPDSRMLKEVEKISDQFKRREQQQREDRNFNQALRQVRDELDSPQPDRDALEQAWRKLQNFSRPVPPVIETGVNEFFRKLQARENAKRRNRILLAVAMIAVLIAGTAAFVQQSRAKQLQERLLQELNILVQAQRLEQTMDFIEHLRQQQPAVHQLPQVQELRERTAAALAAATARDAEFATVTEHLRQIRDNGYTENSARINRLLRQGTDLAEDPAESEAIRAWEQAWKNFMTARQEERNREFTTLFQAVVRAMDARQRLATGPVEIEQSRIQESRQQLVSLENATEGVDPELTAGIPDLRQRLQEWEADLNRRIRELAAAATKKDRLLSTFDRAVPNLDAYQKILNEFVTDFADTPEAASFRRALAEMDMSRDTLALSSLRLASVPPLVTEVPTIEEQLKNLPAGENSIWHADLQRSLSSARMLNRAKAELLTLRGIPGYTTKQMQIRPVAQAEWQTVYYPEEIFTREEKLADGRTVTVFWGQVFDMSADDLAPWLKHLRHNSTEYELRIQRREENNLVPHARFIRSFLAELDASPEAQADLGVYLLQRAMLLAADNSIDIIPRAAIVEKFMRTAAMLLPEINSEIQQLADILTVPEPVLQNWINARHQTVSETRAKLALRLQGIPKFEPLLQRVRLNRRVLQTALSRQLRCVGCIRQNDKGMLEPVINVGTVETAWIATVARDSGRRVFMEAVRRQPQGGYEIITGLQGQMFLGQLLFAPRDGRAAAAVLSELQLPPGSNPLWPQSWPVNARTVIP